MNEWMNEWTTKCFFSVKKNAPVKSYVSFDRLLCLLSKYVDKTSLYSLFINLWYLEKKLTFSSISRKRNGTQIISFAQLWRICVGSITTTLLFQICCKNDKIYCIKLIYHMSIYGDTEITGNFQYRISSVLMTRRKISLLTYLSIST